MVDPLVNDVILGLSGFLIGLLAVFVSSIRGQGPSEPIPKRQPGESFFHWVRRSSSEQPQTPQPRSEQIAFFTLGAFTVLLVIVLLVSPLRWRWIPFAIGVAPGLIGQAVIGMVQQSKRPPEEPPKPERPPEEV
jgi:hypothetical protein